MVKKNEDKIVHAIEKIHEEPELKLPKAPKSVMNKLSDGLLKFVGLSPTSSKSPTSSYRKSKSPEGEQPSQLISQVM